MLNLGFAKWKHAIILFKHVLISMKISTEVWRFSKEDCSMLSPKVLTTKSANETLLLLKSVET